MSFWGKTLMTASAIPAAVVGVGKGIYNATSGEGSFETGFNEAAGGVLNSAEKLGDDHGSTITKAAIGLAATIVGFEYKKHRG